MPRNSEVSITRCASIDDIANVRKAVAKALDLIGGLNSVLRAGDQVILKPNLLLPVDYRSGAVTNPFVIEALVDLLADMRIRKVIIGEGAVVGEDTWKCFKSSGIEEVAQRKKVRLLDFKKDEFVSVGIATGVVYRLLKIPKTVADSDAVVNVPVLKTHDCLSVSLGLKNMKGVLQDRDKQKFHLLDLVQCIVDMNKVVLPRITVIDGTVGMEGMGPVYGVPADMKLIVASFDAVSADAVASALMGIDPYSIGYIRLAEEQGLGVADLSRIQVLGETIKEAGKKFKRVVLEEVLRSDDFKKFNVRFLEANACSGCRNTVTAIISDLAASGKLERLENTTIAIGPNIGEKDLASADGKIICLGACTKSIKAGKALFLPGCPPHILDVKKALGFKKDDFDNFAFLATHLKSFGWH